MKKKLVSLLLAAVMLFAVAAPALAEEADVTRASDVIYNVSPNVSASSYYANVRLYTVGSADVVLTLQKLVNGTWTYVEGSTFSQTNFLTKTFSVSRANSSGTYRCIAAVFATSSDGKSQSSTIYSPSVVI